MTLPFSVTSLLSLLFISFCHFLVSCCHLHSHICNFFIYDPFDQPWGSQGAIWPQLRKAGSKTSTNEVQSFVKLQVGYLPNFVLYCPLLILRSSPCASNLFGSRVGSPLLWDAGMPVQVMEYLSSQDSNLDVHEGSCVSLWIEDHENIHTSAMCSVCQANGNRQRYTASNGGNSRGTLRQRRKKTKYCQHFSPCC